MTSVGSQQKNDCVIVAISNATGKDYKTVQTELGVTSTPDGIQLSVYRPYLIRLGWTKRQSIPRRGQDKITGIARLIGSSRIYGHLVYIKSGIVYDILAPNGMPIKDYQKLARSSHITEIWNPPIVIPTPVVDNPNWVEELELLFTK